MAEDPVIPKSIYGKPKNDFIIPSVDISKVFTQYYLPQFIIVSFTLSKYIIQENA